MIFAYLGPGRGADDSANFHFLVAPPDAHVHQTKLHHACNYLQANEGNFDPRICRSSTAWPPPTSPPICAARRSMR